MTQAMQAQEGNAAAPQQGAAAGKQANEFLTFTLGQEEYGVEILKVQ